MLQTLTLNRPSAYLTAGAIGLGIGGLALYSPIAATLVVGGVMLSLLTLRHPMVLCYIMVAAVTLFSGMPRGQFVPNLRLNELLLVLCLGFATLVVLANRGLAGNLRRAGFVLAASLVLITGTIIVPVIYFYGSGQQPQLEGLLQMASPLKFVLLFLLFIAIPRDLADWRPLIVWIVVCGALVALVGLLQAARFEPVLELIRTWYNTAHTRASLDNSDGRVTSVMGAWNTLGMLLMAAIAIGWAALQVPELRPYRPVLVVSLVTSFLCLVASGSFAGFGGLLVTILLVELLTNRPSLMVKRLLLALVIAAAGLTVAFPLIGSVVLARLDWQFGDGNLLPQTFVYRFWIWEDVFWPAIVANPVFGTSLDIPSAYRWQYAESHYVSLLFHFGVVGLAAHLLWVGLMLAWLYRRLRVADELARRMAAVGIAMLVYLSLAALTNEVFLFTGSIDYLWILFALVATATKAPEQ